MFRLAIGVALAAMALGACSGSHGQADPPASSSTAKAGSTTTTTTTTTTTGGGGTIADLATKTATADVKITYKGALGPDATLAQDGQGKSAFLSGGKLLLSDGTTVISCDGTTAQATCTDLGTAGSDDALAQLITSYASLSTLKQTSLGVPSTQTIAGRASSCVTFKASDYAAGTGGLPDSNKLTAAATVTICVDDDSGFALKIALSDRGQSVDELVATQVGTPSPSDFVPPSTPVPLAASTTTVP